MKPRLLVVELWGVGDLAIATPFLHAASEKYDVTVLAKPYALDLQARFWPDVKVVTFNAPWTAFTHKYRFWSWPWRDMFALRRRFAPLRFDYGVSARWGDPRDHFLLRWFRVKNRLGFPRLGSKIFLTRPLSQSDPTAHHYDSWRQVGRALGVELPPRQQLGRPISRATGPILVHTGARLPARVWPLDHYQSIVRRLRESNHRVQVACDPDQQDWWRTAGEPEVATPRTVTELLSLIDRASAFVGNCSGPGHLAAISGVPTFTIFGPSLPEWFAPLHPAAEWIEGRPCPYRPCSDYCHFPVNHCLANLTEATVWPRVRDFAARHTGAAAAAGAIKTGVPERNGTPVRAKVRRLLHVNNSADIYGASRMLLRFLKTVDLEHFQPIVVLPEDGLLKDLLEAEGVEVIMHRRLSVITRPVFKSWRIVPFFLTYPFSVFFLWRLIRHRHIDLVHTNTGVMVSPALAARLAGVPHIWHVRDWFQEFRSFWPAYSRYMKSMSHKIVAVSHAVADQFEPHGTAMVIHDGFSMDEFELPMASLRQEFRARYKLGDAFVVGCVGRIKYVRKGQEILVEAASILKGRGRRITALIVGAPFPGNESHLQQLEGLVRELGVEDQVVLTGELPDARPAYAAMDVVALTSAQPEPFGGVVMEGMAMGIPVVATNIGGSLDQVVDGVTGILVPPGEPEALANAIEKLMDDPELCRRMGAAGRERIRDCFTLMKMTGEMEDLFEKTIKAANQTS